MARRRFVDISVHCFSPEHLPFYADCLQIQLESIANTHTGVRTRVWVCHLPEPLDARTNAVVRRFMRSGRLSVAGIELPEREMFRRAIGRDKLCRHIAQDSLGVWFADADHVVSKGGAESLHGLFVRPSGPLAAYPLTYPICRDHATGDRLIAEWAKSGVPAVPDTSLFVTENPVRAIGGQMFVRGDQLGRGYCYARQRRPVTWKRFHAFTCDIAYRRFLLDFGVRFEKADVPGIYRLRHTEAGYRDEVWQGRETS